LTKEQKKELGKRFVDRDRPNYISTNGKEKEVIMKCNKHPKYKAINRPNTNCDGCWQIYCDTHNMTWIELLKSLQKYAKNGVKEAQSYGKSTKHKEKVK
jgi:hypothetical protein